MALEFVAERIYERPPTKLSEVTPNVALKVASLKLPLDLPT